MPLEKSEASTSGSEFPFSEEDEIMEVEVDQEEDDDDVVLVESRSHKPGSAASTTTVADIGTFKAGFRIRVFWFDPNPVLKYDRIRIKLSKFGRIVLV